MNENPDKLRELSDKLEKMLKTQDSLSKELSAVKAEIHRLRTNPETPPLVKINEEPLFEIPRENSAVSPPLPPAKPIEIPRYVLQQEKQRQNTLRPKGNLEKFIGENLINKIGILIVVIGVIIGAKYSIEHDLISPLTRIVLGYMAGAVLMVLGIKLKKNYENYSSVLVSGAIAIVYFITFVAYSFYGLIPQALAFGLMFMFTAFTVVAALNYNRQVIGHIGLVGAYAVPFLLSDGSGRAGILFTYIAIINAGIMVIAFRKYWKLLYANAFVFTWFIYAAWYNTGFLYEQFNLAFAFLIAFFLIFYITFLIHKISQNELFVLEDIVLMLANSFVFFGLGYHMLSRFDVGSQMLGVFTLGNAVIHFVVSVVLYKKKLTDKNLFYLVAGLVLVFITIAVPVQLEGNWVTWMWCGEAVLLFWLGRARGIAPYEALSYPLMVLAFCCLLLGWFNYYDNVYLAFPDKRYIPLFNIRFFTSLLAAVAFGHIAMINYRNPDSQALKTQDFKPLVSSALPAVFLLILYMSFCLEISAYWGQREADSALKIPYESEYGGEYWIWNNNLSWYKNIWLMVYTMFFFSALSFANIKWLKSWPLAYVTLMLNALIFVCFLTLGLYDLSELRDSYINQNQSEYYVISAFNLVIRYIAFVFVAGLMTMSAWLVRQHFVKPVFKKPFDILLHIAIVWICSSELIHWLRMNSSDHAYKLGISILWGSYALMMIALGIWKHKKHLRISAIVLFGITLIKLFVYDISGHNTIAKTILFVSLGILLLVISFLYNKYRHIIFDEDKN